MELSPREKDRLLLFTAALPAERRIARSVMLNYLEAVAYISAAILEGARWTRRGGAHGIRTHVAWRGRRNGGLPELLPDVQIEVTSPDGTRLITVHDPVL